MAVSTAYPTKAIATSRERTNFGGKIRLHIDWMGQGEKVVNDNEEEDYSRRTRSEDEIEIESNRGNVYCICREK